MQKYGCLFAEVPIHAMARGIGSDHHKIKNKHMNLVVISVYICPFKEVFPTQKSHKIASIPENGDNIGFEAN